MEESLDMYGANPYRNNNADRNNFPVSNHKELGVFTLKIWITKYALTKGVIEADTETDLSIYRKVKIGSNKGKLMYFPENRNLKLPYSAINPNDYFDTKEKAIEKAEKMRKDKILKLKSQIEQLEGTKFN